MPVEQLDLSLIRLQIFQQYSEYKNGEREREREGEREREPYFSSIVV